MDLRARLRRLQKLDKRTSAEVGCICFPPDEPPQLQLKAEVESARSVLCPLHGERFAKVAPAIWRVIESPSHMNLSEWSGIRRNTSRRWRRHSRLTDGRPRR
jgi:hypothetical protein